MPVQTATTIRPMENGPLVLDGDFHLLDACGNAVEHPAQVALCRCGASGNKPHCDGTHKRVGFQAPGVTKG